VNGIIGKRNGNWFQCTSGAIFQADFNSGRNLAMWDNRACPVDFQKPISVMNIGNLQDGVIGSPPNSMNIKNGRTTVIQLSLFDCTNFETRRENPTRL
ncbi:MAG: hypothetical protein AAGF26_02305, partial [Cyanobacteria bacterium P01_G01_bin.49]